MSRFSCTLISLLSPNVRELKTMGNPASDTRKKTEKRRKKYEERLGPGVYLPKEERLKFNEAVAKVDAEAKEAKAKKDAAKKEAAKKKA